MAALSARLAFVFLCLGLAWGVFTTTGWIYRFTGRQATRSSHMILVSFALAFSTLHGLAFLLMDEHITVAMVLVPLVWHSPVIALGIVSLEGMLAIWLSTAIRRSLQQRRWMWLHRLGYPAVALGVVHAFIGGAADGMPSLLWTVGLAIAVPVGLLAAVRFVPRGTLSGLSLVRADS